MWSLPSWCCASVPPSSSGCARGRERLLVDAGSETPRGRSDRRASVRRRRCRTWSARRRGSARPRVRRERPRPRRRRRATRSAPARSIPRRTSSITAAAYIGGRIGSAGEEADRHDRARRPPLGARRTSTPPPAGAATRSVPTEPGSPWPSMRHDRRNTGSSPLRGRYHPGDRPVALPHRQGRVQHAGDRRGRDRVRRLGRHLVLRASVATAGALALQDRRDHRLRGRARPGHGHVRLGRRAHLPAAHGRRPAQPPRSGRSGASGPRASRSRASS